MTTTEETPKLNTHGGWRRPKSGGLMGLGEGGTRFMFAGIIIDIIIGVFVGRLPAIVIGLLLFLTLYGLTREDQTGRNMLVRANGKIRWTRAKLDGTNLHRTGPLTPTVDCPLPGTLGGTVLSEHEDIHGNPFGMISYKSGHHVVDIRVHPTGVAGVDVEDINTMVGQWGGWLASHAMLTGLTGASIVVTTSPDTGAGLRRTIDGSAAENRPDLAVRVHEALKQRYTVGSPNVKVIITLTFDESIRVGKRRKLASAESRREEVAGAIAMELPQLLLDLSNTGAGHCVLMDAQEIAEVERIAWDPSARAALDDARANGEPLQALSWRDVGPIGYREEEDHLVHDGVVTTVAVMTEKGAPRRPVPPLILRRMLSPQPGMLATRVAIHYQVIPLEHASKIAMEDHKNATFNSGAKTGPVSAASKLEVAAADKTAMEEASGAGMVNFGIALSATVQSIDELEAAKKQLRVMGNSAQIQTRIATGQQAHGFALTQPLGMPNSLATK